jgi:hypothetical protein
MLSVAHRQVTSGGFEGLHGERVGERVRARDEKFGDHR